MQSASHEAQSGIICDVCEQPVADRTNFSSCALCVDDDDFDICQTCTSAGAHCHNIQHVLLQWRCEDNKIINVATGRSYQFGEACVGCRCRAGRHNNHEPNAAIPEKSYVYRPLTSDTKSAIRLLILEPDDHLSPLRYTLHTKSLGDHPEYIALSYAWGDLGVTEPTICNGRRFDVTTNLASALRQLRSHKALVYMWIDAICINQQDEKGEKPSQISMMRQIYQQSARVFVWLGEDHGEVHVALDAIRKIGLEQAAHVNHQPHSDTECGPSDITTPGPAFEVNRVEEEAFKQFFQRSWFTRTWVVQEVCLWQSEPPLVFCGPHVLPWHLFLYAWMGLKRLDLSIPQDKTRLKTMGLRYRIDALEIASSIQESRIAGIHQTLHRLLKGARSLQTAKVHDKVFALLGLVDERCEPADGSNTATQTLLDGRPSLKIDYTVPASELFETVARDIIHRERSLSILSSAEDTEEVSVSKSSWVPDWTRLPIAFTLEGLGTYRAASCTTAYLNDVRKPHVLDVAACVVDQVAICSARPFVGEELLPLSRSLWVCFGSRLKDYPTGELSLDAFWRTLVANTAERRNMNNTMGNQLRYSFIIAVGITGSGDHRCVHPIHPLIDMEPGSTRRQEEQPASMANIIPRRAHNDGSKSIVVTLVPNDDSSPAETTHAHIKSPVAYQSSQPSSQSTKSNARDIEILSSGLKELFQEDETKTIYGHYFERSADKACNGRRFFVTRRGFMGIGPLRAKTGDTVAILKGGNVPYILRHDREEVPDDKQGNLPKTFKLVGEAYIHGLSDGQGIAHMKTLRA